MMMENYTRDNILVLAISEKSNHLSHTCEGCHVFISQFFLEYSGLPVEEQCLLVCGPVASDEGSYNSIDTILHPKVWDLLKLDNIEWKESMPQI